MKVLLAVIEDLYSFLYSVFSGAVQYKKTQIIPFAHEDAVMTPQEMTSQATVKIADPATTDSVHQLSPLQVGYQYFVGESGTYFYKDPVLAFDGALQELSYGQCLRLVGLQGRWAQVRINERIGWVYKDSLYHDANSIYPRFTTAEIYTYNHLETTKLRMVIDDEFGGGRGGFSLQAPEYIYFKLKEKHKQIHWGGIRNRVAGTWQHKLRGHTGVHIGITPKTDSVMEYTIDDFGYQAFVEAVFPDRSIHVTQIGKSDESYYTDEMMTEAQWRELRPVFIAIL